MTRTALVLLFLAGCAAPVAPTEMLVVPDDLATCPGPAPAPIAPPMPRTAESLAAGYNRAQAARHDTEAALRVCTGRVEQLYRLLTL